MTVAQSSPTPREADTSPEKLAAIHKDTCGGLLSLLEQLQHADPYNHLPQEVAKRAAAAMGVPLSQVYSVLTFYSFFNLKPQGEHTITVCRGTACHTRGSRALLESLVSAMGLDRDPEAKAQRLNVTTADKRFTLRSVACFGQCALAPVVEMDHTIHGHLNRQKMLAALTRLNQKGTKP